MLSFQWYFYLVIIKYYKYICGEFNYISENLMVLYFYSYLNASIGSSFAALPAGYTPKIIPIELDMITTKSIIEGERTGVKLKPAREETTAPTPKLPR